jgi:hypothetical protein
MTTNRLSHVNSIIFHLVIGFNKILVGLRIFCFINNNNILTTFSYFFVLKSTVFVSLPIEVRTDCFLKL